MTTALAEARPLKLSWSRIRTHEECQEKAHLKYVAGVTSPMKDVRVFFRGTVVDRVMRDWLSQDDPQPGQMAGMVAQVLDREERVARETGDGIVKWKHASDKEMVLAWCTRLVVNLEPLLFQHVIPYAYQPAVRFEAPLTVPYLDGTPRQIILHGEMDLLIRWPDGQWVILDLKATEDTGYWRKTLGQLIFYEIASFGMSGGRWPAWSGIIQPMCAEMVLPFTFSEAHRMEMMHRISKVATETWAGLHRPKADNRGCDQCEVARACPRFAAIPGTKRVPIGI